MASVAGAGAPIPVILQGRRLPLAGIYIKEEPMTRNQIKQRRELVKRILLMLSVFAAAAAMAVRL